MIGGLQKNISRVAIAAIAGAMCSTAGMAADLGGDCCSDLEERIAELEAGTVRKGNRRVSLTVSGHVNEAIAFWEVSGANGSAYNNAQDVSIGTSNSSRSRFRFKGDATINTDWSAGFLMEFGVRRNDLSGVSQSTPLSSKGIDVRHEALYLNSKKLGTVWLGWTSTATDGITEICLGCGLGNGPDYGDDLGADFTARNGARFDQHGGASGYFAGEGDRRNVVRYISPTFAGFAVSASVSGDDYWDIALRYAREFKDFRVGFGAGYSQDTDVTTANISGASCTSSDAESDRSCQSIGMSGSLMHVPTGLYIASAYGWNHDELDTTGNDTNYGWHITAGMNRKLNALGSTNFWVMYSQNEREIGLNSGLDIYGVGVEQKIDAAAMEVYLWYKRMEAEVDDADGGEADQVLLGSRIKF